MGHWAGTWPVPGAACGPPRRFSSWGPLGEHAGPPVLNNNHDMQCTLRQTVSAASSVFKLCCTKDADQKGRARLHPRWRPALFTILLHKTGRGRADRAQALGSARVRRARGARRSAPRRRPAFWRAAWTSSMPPCWRRPTCAGARPRPAPWSRWPCRTAPPCSSSTAPAAACRRAPRAPPRPGRPKVARHFGSCCWGRSCGALQLGWLGREYLPECQLRALLDAHVPRVAGSPSASPRQPPAACFLAGEC